MTTRIDCEQQHFFHQAKSVPATVCAPAGRAQAGKNNLEFPAERDQRENAKAVRECQAPNSSGVVNERTRYM